MIGDRHVHTMLSLDSEAKIEDVLDSAVSRGMKEIFITDHCDMDLGPDWLQPVDRYVETLEHYRKAYAGKIEMHIGIEIGLNPEYNDQINSFLASYPFELVIGSVHTMLGKDPYYREEYDMDDREYYAEYFRTVLERLQAENRVHVLGHLDYVVRYSRGKGEDYDPAEYAGVLEEILKHIITRDIALELNTGGLRKGLDFVHPHEYILGMYKDMGGRYLSIGSDAHMAGHVGAGFEEAFKLMKRLGFGEDCIIR